MYPTPAGKEPKFLVFPDKYNPKSVVTISLTDIFTVSSLYLRPLPPKNYKFSLLKAKAITL